MVLWALKGNPEKEAVLDYLDLKVALGTLAGQDLKGYKDLGESSEDLEYLEKRDLKVKEAYQVLMVDQGNKELKVYKDHRDRWALLVKEVYK